MIYTAIIGGKDPVRNDIKVFRNYNRFSTPRMNAKIFKILSHSYIKDEISVWLDGNIYPLKTEKEIVDLMGDADMMVFRHPFRTNIYDEAKQCQFLKKDNAKIIDEQMETNPKVRGLFECGVLVRRNNEVMRRFNEAWWAEICRYSSRDQLSFPCMIQRFPEIKIKIIEGNIRNHEYFKYVEHNHER